MKKNILKYLAQIVMIVFSVVLGIFLSERIEESKKEKEAALLLSKLKSELNTNQKILANWTPYHQEIVKNLDSLLAHETFIDRFIEDKTTLFREVLTRGSLMKDMPSNDAWDIAKSHPLIVHFEYEHLLILSKIYNQQDMTFETIPQLLELFLSADFNSEEKAKQNLQAFKNNLREVASRELQLMYYLQEADKILEYQKD